MQKIVKRDKEKYFLEIKEFLKGEWLKEIQMEKGFGLEVEYKNNFLTIIKYKVFKEKLEPLKEVIRDGN